MKKPRVVSDWRRAWKWLSIQIPALNIAFLSTWALLPPKFQDAISAPWAIGIAVGLIAAGMFGRLIDQKPKE